MMGGSRGGLRMENIKLFSAKNGNHDQKMGESEIRVISPQEQWSWNNVRWENVN